MFLALSSSVTIVDYIGDGLSISTGQNVMLIKLVWPFLEAQIHTSTT